MKNILNNSLKNAQGIIVAKSKNILLETLKLIFLSIL